jgi:hypothetical protein
LAPKAAAFRSEPVISGKESASCFGAFSLFLKHTGWKCGIFRGAWHIECRPWIEKTRCATGFVRPAHTEITTSNPKDEPTVVWPLTPETPTKPSDEREAKQHLTQSVSSQCGDGIDLHREEKGTKANEPKQGITRKCKCRETRRSSSYFLPSLHGPTARADDRSIDRSIKSS